ncbi:MAG TPA: hypothetical protein VMX38_01375 [Verrucomicrobiae bacterium]|nr:hypothetical protein [Verrucomicrobiae bacterium]
MNLKKVDEIARAVLYEGYLLYPYRPSSVKNQQRFNFGVLHPQAYSEAQSGTDACSLQAECLLEGDSDAAVEVRLRFLHLRLRMNEDSPETDSWQEAEEREMVVPPISMQRLCEEPVREGFVFPSGMRGIASGMPKNGPVQRRVCGIIEITAEKLRDDVSKISVVVRNATAIGDPACSRDQALMRSLISAHLVLGAENGKFVSLLEPPGDMQAFAKECQNVGVWPVLVGEAGERDTMLASPIILYDYPQIAPESAGDLFDGTEIDEILSLRIMTLTEEEKQEIRQSDERARQILERTENMPAEQFIKLHGAVRGLRPLGKETP